MKQLVLIKIFNNLSFLGGLDTSEPWQGEWNGGVLVECVGRPDVPRRPAAAQPKRIPVAPKKTEDEG